MNKIKIALLFLLFYTVGLSQNKVYTDIQKNKKTYPGKPYSFEKVVDARTNKDNIGIVYKTDLSREYYADLHDPLDVAVMKFLNTTFPNGSPSAKITLIINNFEIGHKVSGRIKDSGFVNVNFDFYRTMGDSSILIHHYTGSVVDVSDNIALSHSNRMKRAILLSVASLDSIVLKGSRFHSLPKKENDTLVTVSKRDTVKKMLKGVTKENINETEKMYEANNLPRNIIFMVGAHAIFSPNTYMYGGNVNVLFRFKRRPKALLGFNLNYSVINFRDDYLVPANTAYSLKTSDFGLRYLRQLKNFIFYNFNPHLLIGRETFETLSTNLIYVTNAGTTQTITNSTSQYKTFIGGQFDNGIYFMSPRKTGAYFGVDLVMRFTNSSVFDTDIGLKLNLGLAF